MIFFRKALGQLCLFLERQPWLFRKKCPLTHIPTDLHWDRKSIIGKFYESEEIYRRCQLNLMNDPYKSISLYDLSVNRQGNPQKPISNASDVLLNCLDNTSTNYQGYGVLIMKIEKLINRNKYIRTYELNDGNEKHEVVMKLKHDPIPCMFPHTVFEFVLDGVVVNKQNYKSSLGKDNRKFSRLRQYCKAELTDIIIKRIIDFQEGEPIIIP